MIENKNGSKLAILCVCQVYELFMKLGAPGGPPTTQDPADFSIFLFYSLYTSMVTENKFFTFPASLTALAPGL